MSAHESVVKKRERRTIQRILQSLLLVIRDGFSGRFDNAVGASEEGLREVGGAEARLCRAALESRSD